MILIDYADPVEMNESFNQVAYLNLVWLLFALALCLAVTDRIEIVLVATASAELKWQAFGSLFIVMVARDIFLTTSIDGWQSAWILNRATLVFTFVVRFEVVVVAGASTIAEYFAESVLTVVIVA